MSGLQPHERHLAFQSQVFHFKPGVYRGGGKGEIRAPKSPNNVASKFLITVHLILKDLRFEYGGAKPNLFLASGAI